MFHDLGYLKSQLTQRELALGDECNEVLQEKEGSLL